MKYALLRKDHDILLEADPALLQRLFATSQDTSWSCMGATLYGIPAELVAEAHTLLTVLGRQPEGMAAAPPAPIPPPVPARELLVELRNVFGREMVYPINTAALAIADLAASITLTPQAIATAQRLGFTVRELYGRAMPA